MCLYENYGYLQLQCSTYARSCNAEFFEDSWDTLCLALITVLWLLQRQQLLLLWTQERKKKKKNSLFCITTLVQV